MDPLSALRDFTIRGELDRIVRSGDDFHFGSDYSFPCSAETAYRSKQGSLYTLETLVFFVRHHHLKHTDYLQSSRLRRLPSVTLPDRKPLLDYLHGRVSSSDAIDLLPPPSSAAVAAPPSSSVEEYRPDDPAIPDDDPDEPRPPQPDRVLDYVSLIRTLERPLKDRESLLECRNRDLYAVLTASTRREEERHRLESQQRKDGLVAKTRLIGADNAAAATAEDVDSTPKPKMHLKGSKVGEGVPIILVPSASQTLITIYNVKEFLEDGVFVPSEAKMKMMKPGSAKPDCVTVQKKLSRDRAVAAYEVRDKPSGFKPDDWDRVVAVFVLGKEWQFKDWPFKDHVEIFNKIIGFFVRFEDDSVESAKIVKQWNVKIISISKNKRHQDRAAALEVWDRLEEFMRSRSHT
ncbi:protein CDC73-like protein [Iris pallida]|uniref:Protein CDC73-like protein n=1 Tax=Iris pallida TaxID=29817 RepID=A0AAX6I0S4_IRIPA|nr:protein CDC73-like protein [Iris pallida]